MCSPAVTPVHKHIAVRRPGERQRTDWCLSARSVSLPGVYATGTSSCSCITLPISSHYYVEVLLCDDMGRMNS